MGRLRNYWRNLTNEQRERYANKFGSSVANTEQRYVCRSAGRRQRPSIKRMALMIKESGGAVTAEGLAFEFVVEPLFENNKVRNKKAPASRG